MSLEYLFPSSNTDRLPLIVIIGPTAVGKTEVSLKLAERYNGEIVSADSRLFYRRMDIGTAKPSLEERARIRHHLVDVVDPDEIWSLAKFQRETYSAVYDISSRGRLPFLVGGTGQYVRAIVEGWDIPGQKPDPALRKALEAWSVDIGTSGLHERLSVLDPPASIAIDPRNLRRTIRALEVILSTGKKFSSQRKRRKPLFNTLQLGLIRPREILYQRIDQRIDNMIEIGFVEEVQRLLHLGYSPELPSMSAIGYREIIDYLDGRTTLDEAKRLISRATRIYVRRQANWFKTGDPSIHWFEIDDDTDRELGEVINSFLSTNGLEKP